MLFFLLVRLLILINKSLQKLRDSIKPTIARKDILRVEDGHERRKYTNWSHKTSEKSFRNSSVIQTNQFKNVQTTYGIDGLFALHELVTLLIKFQNECSEHLPPWLSLKIPNSLTLLSCESIISPGDDRRSLLIRCTVTR